MISDSHSSACAPPVAAAPFREKEIGRSRKAESGGRPPEASRYSPTSDPSQIRARCRTNSWKFLVAGKSPDAERCAVLVFRLPYASILAFAQTLGPTTRAFGNLCRLSTKIVLFLTVGTHK